MTTHPIYTLQAHILHLAFVCNCPALYVHHVELFFHFHALDCTEPDSIFVWEVYRKADKARREAQAALWEYIESKQMYLEHREELEFVNV